MRKFPHFLAVALIGALSLPINSTMASPLANGLRNGSPPATEFQDDLVQKVHRWHCQKRKGWYKGKTRWHRHPRACSEDGYVHRYPHPRHYWGEAPLPYYGYWDWQRERSNWLWD